MTATVIPSSAKVFARTAPSPEPPPVITATRSPAVLTRSSRSHVTRCSTRRSANRPRILARFTTYGFENFGDRVPRDDHDPIGITEDNVTGTHSGAAAPHRGVVIDWCKV